MIDHRKSQLAYWIGKQFDSDSPELVPVSGDASFRRYFRFTYLNDNYIAVDAPVEHENNPAFHKIALLLTQFELFVPKIVRINLELGFLVLSDLGDKLYLPHLNSQTADDLYKTAIDAIVKMIEIPKINLTGLSTYNSDALNQEMNLFSDWFIQHHLKLQLTPSEQKLIDNTFLILTNNALKQKQHFVHRDFHSRNLMICEAQKLGIIDFQDAVIGPISYDLVSLLKDCYIQWPEDQVKNWCLYYYQRIKSLSLIEDDFDNFYKQFELMGMQRHLKVLGIFCRLNYRDNKPGYLKDLQLTFDYLIKAVAKYPELNAFNHFLQNRIQPLIEK